MLAVGCNTRLPILQHKSEDPLHLSIVHLGRGEEIQIFMPFRRPKLRPLHQDIPAVSGVIAAKSQQGGFILPPVNIIIASKGIQKPVL